MWALSLKPSVAYLATGWQEKAQRDMEEDAPEMIRQGYRVVSTEERQVPAFGMYWLDVTYELVDRNHAVG